MNEVLQEYAEIIEDCQAYAAQGLHICQDPEVVVALAAEVERLEAENAALREHSWGDLPGYGACDPLTRRIHDADARLGAMVRRMPPGWMLGHEGSAQRRVTATGQLLPYIAPGAWRVSVVTVGHYEEVRCVEREPDQALRAALALNEWAESTDADADARLAAALGEGTPC